MSELFKEEYNEANEKLFKAGYYVVNMTGAYNNNYEIYNKEGQVVMDYLTLSQLIQLSNILSQPKPPSLGGLGQGGNLPTDEASRKERIKVKL